MPRNPRRQYSPLGKLIDRLARERDVRGPLALTEFVRQRTGEGPSRSAWSQFLFGDIKPTAKTMTLFVIAFELTEEERVELALVYTFGETFRSEPRS